MKYNIKPLVDEKRFQPQTLTITISDEADLAYLMAIFNLGLQKVLDANEGYISSDMVVGVDKSEIWNHLDNLARKYGVI